MRFLPWITLVVLVVVGGAWVARTWMSPPAPEEPVPVLGPVPDFQLTRDGGDPFSRADLAGEVWVASFVFTRCRGQCPVLVSRMLDLQQDVPRLRLVSFTVDPEHDTPERLAEFAQEVGADPKRWAFVTGPRDSLYELSQRGFLLGVAAAADPEGADQAEPVLHSPRFVLVDRAGRVRGYYSGLESAERNRLTRDARQLLGEPDA